MNAPVVPLKNLGTLPEQAAPPLCPFFDTTRPMTEKEQHPDSPVMNPSGEVKVDPFQK
ncbi:hypothetical protein VSR82_38855 [Burkholderia sp. JPY481]